MSTTRAEAPFRWPGGKRRLAGTILHEFPDTFGTYFEPFLGAAAVYFRLRPARAVLSDHNDDLVNFFKVLRDDPNLLHEALASLEMSERTYYSVRRHKPVDRLWRAARFAYLTTLAFNGIYRVNQQGRFNVPFGKRSNSSLRARQWIDELSSTLQSAEIRTADFEDAVRPARPGDLIYFDPPYTTRHDNNGFVRYNERIFRFEDQERLALVAGELVARGCHVFVSNAHHDSVRDLYPDFAEVELSRRSLIAASPIHRGRAFEYLLVSRRNPGVVAAPRSDRW